MGSFSKPSSLFYLNDETPRTPERSYAEVPRTPERSSASSIITTTPSAPRKPRRPSSESPFHHYTSFDRVRVPNFASTAMDLDPVLENEMARGGTTATNTSSGGSSRNNNDEASYQSTTSSPHRNGKDIGVIHSEDAESELPRFGRRQYYYPASIERILTYDAPEVFLDDDLTLLSYGPSLAIALDDQLFLCQRDTPQMEVFTCTQDGNPISCVQWSPKISKTDKSILAVGLEASVQLWSVERGGTLLEFHGHSGFVTAIGWKTDGTELLIASSGAGIHRYNLLAADPNNNCLHYEGGEASTCLRWCDRKKLIASAGNGFIKVWDATNKRDGGPSVRPFLTLPHTGVRCLEFSPSGNCNLMASGGDGGIHFWNIDSGLLRGSIPTDAPVTALIWSCVDEIMAAHGAKLSIWNVETSTTPQKIAQLETDGKILCLAKGLDGRIACLNANETCSVLSIQGDSTMASMGENKLLKQSAVI